MGALIGPCDRTSSRAREAWKVGHYGASANTSIGRTKPLTW